jgi:hypothetical protein
MPYTEEELDYYEPTDDDEWSIADELGGAYTGEWGGGEWESEDDGWWGDLKRSLKLGRGLISPSPLSLAGLAYDLYGYGTKQLRDLGITLEPEPFYGEGVGMGKYPNQLARLYRQPPVGQQGQFQGSPYPYGGGVSFPMMGGQQIKRHPIERVNQYYNELLPFFRS